MLERIRRKQQEQEQRIEQTPFTILVFGSGESSPKYFKKRQDTVNALKAAKFTAYMCEELGETQPSELYMVEEEALYLQEADWAVFLDTSSGPLSELSAYCLDPDVVCKSFVLYPQKYAESPDRPKTYPEDVLAHYPYNRPYTKSQFDQCDLVPICVQRAKALRYAKYNKMIGKPRALQF